MKILLKSVSILLLSGLLISCDPVKEKTVSESLTLSNITGAAKILKKFGEKIRKQQNFLDDNDREALKLLKNIHFLSDKSINNDAVMTSSMNFNTQEFKTIDSITGAPIDSCGTVENSDTNPTVCNYKFTELPVIIRNILTLSPREPNEQPLTGRVIIGTGDEAEEKTVRFEIVVKAFNVGSWCETDILAGKGYQNCIEPIRRSR